MPFYLFTFCKFPGNPHFLRNSPKIKAAYFGSMRLFSQNLNLFSSYFKFNFSLVTVTEINCSLIRT